MIRQLASLILCGVPLLTSACATKSFVEDQVRAAEARMTEQRAAAEAKLTERVDVQDGKLRETADRVAASRRVMDAAGQRLDSLDNRVGDVGTVAAGAKTRGEAAQDANTRLAQRFARRNSYRSLDTRSVYFEADRADIRNEDTAQLEEIAKALEADVNAVAELQGFADPRGNDRYNNQLARERVEAVTRYLVQRHGVQLRQLQAVSMGKVAVEGGGKPSLETLAKARRVEVRVLAPWFSWEDAAETQAGHSPPTHAITTAESAPRECAPPTATTTVAPPVQTESTALIQVSWVEPAPDRSVSPAPVEAGPPGARKDPPPQSPHARGGAHSGALAEFLKSLSPEDLGGK